MSRYEKIAGSNAVMGDERASFLEVGNANNFLKQLKMKEIISGFPDANYLFFLNEMNFRGVVPNVRVNPPYGHPDTVLIGASKYYEGILARLGLEGANFSLLNISEGWLFDVRTDTEEGGFFHRPQNFSGHFGLNNMNKRLPQINAMVNAVRGYEMVIAGRGLEEATE